MNFNQILLRTYESDIEELKLERAELTYYPGFDGEIVEKFVTCKRPNCICQRGYPHGPNKYFRYREGKVWKELYLGKKIQEEYLTKVESNRRIKEINRELRSLKKKRAELRERLGLADENNETVRLNNQSGIRSVAFAIRYLIFIRNGGAVMLRAVTEYYISIVGFVDA